MDNNFITDEMHDKYMALRNELCDFTRYLGPSESRLGLELYRPFNGGGYSESDWAEIIVAANAIMPENAEWDDWKFIDDRNDCIRLFGCGDKTAELKGLLDVLTQAKDLLCRYAEINGHLPASIQWKVEPVFSCGNVTNYFWDSDHEPLSFLRLVHEGEQDDYSHTTIVVGKKTVSVFRYDDIYITLAEVMQKWLPAMQPVIRDNTPEGPPFIFHRKNDVWEVRYTCDGEREEATFPYSITFERVARLLRNPGIQFSVVDLVRSSEDDVKASEALERYRNQVVDSSESDEMQISLSEHEMLDLLGREEIQKMIESLDDKIAQAAARIGNEDMDQLDEHNRQRDKLYKYLRDGTDVNGNPRLFSFDSSSKPARINVKTSFSRFYTSVEPDMPRFVKHLKASIRKMNKCNVWCYDPAEPIKWIN